MKRTNPFARWKLCDGFQINGVRVEGDHRMPPTPDNPLLLFWYIHVVWQKAAVFRVDQKLAEPKFFIGFHNDRGKIHLRQAPITGVEGKFAMRLGHETCTFFAIDRNDKPVILRRVAVAYIKGPSYQSVPLY